MIKCLSQGHNAMTDDDAHVISTITYCAFSNITGSDKPTQARSLSLARAITAQKLTAGYYHNLDL